MLTKGIITIATGNERYYKMALYLLYSLRISNPEMKMAIITDKQNLCTNEFDDVVILEEPHKSYLDKLDLLIRCPYDENIFIDADSLVFSNIDYLWKCFENGSDFSCLGEKLPLSSKDGFFDYEGAGKYKDEINYITRLHGGLYYVRKSRFCEEFWKLCMELKANYSNYTFKMFKEPADEPIIALACAIKNVELIPKINDICFYPIVKKVNANIVKRKLVYEMDNKSYHATILHFGNYNTEKALYLYQKEKIYTIYKGENSLWESFGLNIKYFYYLWRDYFGDSSKIKNTIYIISPKCIKQIYDTLKNHFRK